MRKKDIFWLILLRLVVIVALSAGAVSIQLSTSTFLPFLPFYALILGIFLLSFLYLALYYWGKHLAFQVYLQTFFDLIWITAIVYVSGALSSSFYFLYIFVVIASSMVLSSRAAYITAALSAIFYGLLADVTYLGVVPPPVTSPEFSSEMSLGFVLNNVFLAWSAFFLVAFLMNYVTRNLRKAREELRLAQKELEVKKSLAAAGEFAAHLAHEIRNPLAAISGSVQVLRDELSLTGEQKDLMKIVMDESQRVSQSIEQFLSLASPSKQTFAEIDLPSVFKETLVLFRRSGELDGEYKIEGNYDAVHVPFFGNTNQFKQIFWNLLKNAVKAMPEGGKLAVDFNRTKNGEVQVQVRDTGEGMTRETQDKLFESFYSGFSSGRGIGLAVVRRIVDEYGGKIRVNSEVNEGTEVLITLPQADFPVK